METQELTLEAEAALLTLVRRIAEVRVRSEERERATYERFNVFTTLLQAHDEVRLHTRFIHCLLDPCGCHDCGPLFLNLFLETLRDPKLGSVDGNGSAAYLEIPDKIGAWSLLKETRKLGHGQLDILLDGGNFGIAIENKIRAHEQPSQLACYAQALEERYSKDWRLFYLTLDGRRGETAANEQYLRISYAVHILEWLEKCLRATYHIVRINQVIQQYRDVVRHLTHRTLNDEAMRPIIEFIRSHPDIVRHSSEIQQGIAEVVSGAWNALEKAISTSLADSYAAGCDDDSGLASSTEAALILNPVTRGIAASVFAEAPFQISAERDDESLGIGIVPYSGGSSPSVNEVFEGIYSRMREMAEDGFHQSDPSERYPAGWHNLLEGDPEDQAAQLLVPGEVERVIAEIREYLDRLARAYSTVQISRTTPAPPHSASIP